MEGYPQKHPQKQLQAVILDWAGTTVDKYCDAPVEAFIECYRVEGVSISMEEARKPMGNLKKVHIAKIAEDEAVRERWKQVHGSYPEETDIDRMFETFVPAQLEALRKYKDLIPGAVESVNYCRNLGMKIGSTTGYNGEMVRLLVELTKPQGYSPDVSVTTDEVGVIREDGSYNLFPVGLPAGRPEPWMCLANAMYMGIYPSDFHTLLKVDDTISGVGEGVNAGMWSVGIIGTGNEVHTSMDTAHLLSDGELMRRKKSAMDKMREAGAHHIIDSIKDLPVVIDEINSRLRKGERP